MAPRTLYQKIWDSHLVETDDAGTGLIYIDRHLVHEVTSPQAFEGLRLGPLRALVAVLRALAWAQFKAWAQGLQGSPWALMRRDPNEPLNKYR